MVYSFKVTLNGIKGFYRIYHLNSENSLYSFHKQMRADMEFPQDQLILFKAFNQTGDVIARYGLFDLGYGAVDDVTVGAAIKKGARSFTYFYDVTNKKSVQITFEGILENVKDVSSPVLADIKGPNPIDFENGYVAFEDLPDDQRHLPSESDKNRRRGLDSLLSALKEDGEEIEDAVEQDYSEEEDDDDDDDIRSEGESIEIFDGSEDLTL